MDAPEDGSMLDAEDDSMNDLAAAAEDDTTSPEVAEDQG